MLTKSTRVVQYILFFICVIYTISSVYSVNLPEYITPCPRDNKLNRCLRKLIREIVPKLALGEAEIGLKPFDPLILEDVPVEFIRPNMELHGVIKNLALTRLSHMRVRSIKSDFRNKNMQLDIFLTIPNVFMESNYEVTGNVLDLVPLKHGYFNATMSNIKTVFSMKGEQTEIDNKIYMKITNVHIDPTIENAYFYMTDLLPNNSNLNEIIKNIMQREWRGVFESMIPKSKQVLGPILIELVNIFFLNFEFDTLMPAVKIKHDQF